MEGFCRIARERLTTRDEFVLQVSRQLPAIVFADSALLGGHYLESIGMSADGKAAAEQPDPQQLLSLSWHDSVWIPALDRNNVMDYFSQRSNPFYDRTCNNEIVRMQRSDLAQLV